MNEKLMEILRYYEDTHTITEPIHEIYSDLIENNVEVFGDSFYCPIWHDETDMWLLLAGTKERADLWVLKKIIKLIKSGDTIITIFNGNSNYLIQQFSRYNIKVVNQDRGISTIMFNHKGN